ncbi:hypothetical protein HID58_048930, partial [Brassica napus]
NDLFLRPAWHPFSAKITSFNRQPFSATHFNRHRQHPSFVVNHQTLPPLFYSTNRSPIATLLQGFGLRLAWIFVTGMSDQHMILKDKKNSSNTLSFASPSCPPNGVPLEDPHSPLPHFMCTELRTVMMNISVYGEMAFYVMPDEFFRTRVLGYSLTKEI